MGTAAATTVEEPDCDGQKGVDTEVGREALEDKADGDLYVTAAFANVFDCSGCTSATNGAKYFTFELVLVMTVFPFPLLLLLAIECFGGSSWDVVIFPELLLELLPPLLLNNTVPAADDNNDLVVMVVVPTKAVEDCMDFKLVAEVVPLKPQLLDDTCL